MPHRHCEIIKVLQLNHFPLSYACTTRREVFAIYRGWENKTQSCL